MKIQHFVELVGVDLDRRHYFSLMKELLRMDRGEKVSW